jgi:uncharacterized protein (TIGR02001 family)
VTARAVRCSRARGHFARLIFAAGCWSLASPGFAQVGAVLSVYSEQYFRGYSISGGHPVALVNLSYDDRSGAYAAVSASAVARDGVHPLAFELNGGYARRLRSGITLDIGAIATRYSNYAVADPRKSDAEIYAGVSGKLLSSRVYFSPHYFGSNRRIVYGELDGHLSPAAKLTIDGHGGVLVPLGNYGPDRTRTEYDWRLGVTRDLGRVALHAAWVAGGPGKDLYVGTPRHRNAVIVGASIGL